MNALSKPTGTGVRVRSDVGVDREKIVAIAKRIGVNLGRSPVPLVTEKRLAWTVNRAVMAFMLLPENQGKPPAKLADLLDDGQDKDKPPLSIKVTRYRDGKRTEVWVPAYIEIRNHMQTLYGEIMTKTTGGAAKLADPEKENQLVSLGVKPYNIMVPLKGGEHSPAAEVAKEAALRCHTVADNGQELRAVVELVGYDFEPEA